MLAIQLPRVHFYLGCIFVASCGAAWGLVGVGGGGGGGGGGFASAFEEFFASIKKIFILVFPKPLRPKSYVV